MKSYCICISNKLCEDLSTCLDYWLNSINLMEVDIGPAAGHDLQRYWSGNGDHVLNWAGCVGVNKLIMNIK